MSVKTYIPKKILVIVGGVPISGFAEDSMVKTVRDEDTFAKKVGVDGEVSRSQNHNRSGTVTITLMQTSPSNDVLSGFAALDELTGAGVVPVLIKDLSGTSTFFSSSCWVKKPPEGAYGKEVGNREWVLDTVDIDIFNGGNI